MIRLSFVILALLLFLSNGILTNTAYALEEDGASLSHIDDEVKNKLALIDLEAVDTDTSIINFFRNIGEKALPAIEDALKSEGNADSRKRGIRAIVFLMKVREYRDEEYKKREDAIISLLLPILARVS